MAQHDYSIANQGFPATRADINNVLSAIATNNSGTSAPSTQYAGQFWLDTTSSNWVLYIHDGADDIQFATIDTSANTVNFIDSELADGSVTNAKLGADAVDGTKIADDSINSEHYVDGSIDTAHIANDAVDNTKLDLADDYTFTGKISGQNYPAFQASLSANQVISDSVSTIVQFNTVLYDTNSDYDNTTYKYTPTISGKYYVYTRIRGVADGGDLRSIQIRMYYGGGIENEAKTAYTVNEITESTLTASSIIDVDASLSQNIRILVSIDVIGGETDSDLVGGDKNQCVFGAYRIGD